MPFLPKDLRPMLPSRAEGPFDSRDHIFELKWGGIRALAFVDGARLRLVSQSGREITHWFPELAGMAAQVKGDGVVLDGEIVALGDEDVPDLSLLNARLCGAPPSGDGAMCLYQAYDILYSEGRSLMERPLIERKDALARLIRDAGPGVLTDYVPGDGIALFEAASERRLAGVVAKRKQSAYRPGTLSADWLEAPMYEEGCFVIGGYALGVGREEPVAALMLGEPTAGGRLRFAGLVQGGVPGKFLEPVLAPFTSPVCPFVTAPDLAKLVYWLRPELVCQVKFARREADGRLRFPLFVTMRPDIDARDLASQSRETRAPNG
ncbi:MAG TPA: hypothetical protein VH951_09080 [Dehalococcoidia bacterium]